VAIVECGETRFPSSSQYLVESPLLNANYGKRMTFYG
jgi:hypothetical protein